MDARATEIVEAIREAFRGVSRGAISLHEAEAIDECRSEKARAAARRIDSERRWEDVPDQHVEGCSNALSFLDPESWRYYIPRYMEWSLCNIDTSDSIVVDFTIYAFSPANENRPNLREWALQRYQLLDPEQSQVVCSFLRYMAGRGDRADDVVASEALRNYWEAAAGNSAA